MNELAEVISGAINEKKQTGSDYTAKVTRVEGSTAYVQITGSDIADTPVAMSVSCKAGDMVRVRVADGKAWITGNDTAPPTDDAEVKEKVSELSRFVVKQLSDGGSYSKIVQTVDQILLEVGKKMNPDMSNRASSISIDSGRIEFKSNSIVINSSKFKLDENGNATFGGKLIVQGDYGQTYGTQETTISNDGTLPIIIRKLNVPNEDYSCYFGADKMMFYYEDTRSSAQSFGKIVDISSDQITVRDLYSADERVRIDKNKIRVQYLTAYTDYDSTGAHPSSDIRLKEDISEVSPETARHLIPVKFRFKGSDKIHYGFIAQDVQKVMPDAVLEDEDGYLSLTYHELIAPLYALVHEQEDRINRLEARLKALEDKQ